MSHRPMPGPPERTSHDRHSAAGFIRSDCPWCASFRADESKRLTDAECAAEYWRAVANLLAAPPHSSEMLSAREKKRVCANFATHPHALEES